MQADIQNYLGSTLTRMTTFIKAELNKDLQTRTQAKIKNNIF